MKKLPQSGKYLDQGEILRLCLYDIFLIVTGTVVGVIIGLSL